MGSRKQNESVRLLVTYFAVYTMKFRKQSIEKKSERQQDPPSTE